MDNIIRKISRGFNAMGYSGNNEEYEEFANETCMLKEFI
jgi:hypothetical protein